MKYKVIGTTGSRLLKTNDKYHLNWAQALKERYGLPFSISEIIETWEEYSDRFAAGWVNDDAESISNAFGVILEEDNE